MSKAVSLGPPSRELRLGRSDEVLGVLGGFLVAMPLWIGLQNDGGFTTGVAIFIAVLAVPGVALILLGMRKRRRKLLASKIWSELEEHRDVPVDRLLGAGNLERSELLEVVARINRAAPEAYLLDEERGTLMDSRLRGRAVVVERCASCGAPVNLSVEVGKVDRVRCPSCGSPVAGTAEQLMERAFAEVVAETAPAGDAKGASASTPSVATARRPAVEFGCMVASLVGFPLILLTLVFGMLFVPPLLASLILWEVLCHRYAPRLPRPAVDGRTAAMKRGWISDPGAAGVRFESDADG